MTDILPDAAETVAKRIPGSEARGLDVTQPRQCAELAESVLRDHGAIDVWVSNAGVSKMLPFLEVTEVDYDRTLDVNLKGVFFACQAAARAMVESGRPGGSSTSRRWRASRAGCPYLADYVASQVRRRRTHPGHGLRAGASTASASTACAPATSPPPCRRGSLAWEAQLAGHHPRRVSARCGSTTLRSAGSSSPRTSHERSRSLPGDGRGFITGEALAVNGGAYMD